MDVNALLKALQTTLRFEQEMASRFGAPTPAPAPPVRRDSGRESDHAFPFSSGVQREPETEVRMCKVLCCDIVWQCGCTF